MATLADLARRLNKKAENIEKDANEVAKTVAVSILQNLLVNTPVDTSKALSNWQVGLGAPVTEDIEAHTPGQSGSTRDVSAQTAFAIAFAQVKLKKPGQVLHITNNAPYILELENGSSKQAPSGFVQFALAKGHATLRKEVKKITE